MNDFELFLNFGAVVEIRRNYRDDLYKFCQLMVKLGFMKENIMYFMVNCGIIEEYKNGKLLERKDLINYLNNKTEKELLEILDYGFTDDKFWHLVDINNGRQSRICVEYQFGKGFTWDLKQNYTNYDETMKVLSVDDLIFVCNKQEEFNLGFEDTTFIKELEDKNKDIAEELDMFCDFYEWSLVKFGNGLYNILDRQTEELVGYFSNENDNGTLRDCIERTYNRMVDYFFDEEDIEGLIQEGSQDYVNNKINGFVTLGKKYHLADDKRIEYFENFKNI